MNIMILNIDKNSKMADLMISNQQILYMLERFNIPLGFKESTIKELANTNNIDENALLVIALLIINNESHAEICNKESLGDIINFLKNSHKSFREKIVSLKRSIDKFSEEISGNYEMVINTFYNEYIQDIEEHFSFEESDVFTYVKSLYDEQTIITNKIINNITDFETNHSNTELKLKDLKNILIKYIPPTVESKYRNQILYKLYELEPDLYLHSKIEDTILVPLVKQIEKENLNL
jgi:regulator of cell morphogenesis and NO signaling